MQQVSMRSRTATSGIWISLFFLMQLGYAGVLQAANAVGTMPGNAGVNQRGAATYAIPIEVAEGIGGLKPQLQLVYNSQARDGLAGARWSLGGLSEITRCNRILATDERIRGVRFAVDGDSVNDRFCLDGNPLVLVNGTYGQAGAEYRKELDTYERVISNGQQGGTGQPQSFTVQKPNGLRYTYGSVSNSRIPAVGVAGAPVRVWALDTIEDKYGNKIVYEYGRDDQDGEYWPDNIRWVVRNGAPVQYRVDFEYDTNLTPAATRSGFTFGAKWKSGRRLDEIVYSADGGSGLAPVHTYTLAYTSPATPSGRSQLSSVQVCGPTECLPETVIDWQDGAVDLGTSGTIGSADHGYKSPGMGDFNGDGAKDMFVSLNGTIHIHVGGPNGLGAAIDTGVSGYAPVLFEYDGDGMTDMVVGDTVWRSTGVANQWTQIGDLPPPPSGYYLGRPRIALDLTGDGRDELLEINHYDELFVRYNDSWFAIGSFSTNIGPPMATNLTGQTPDLAQFHGIADFDGDGRADLLVRGLNGAWSEWHAFRAEPLAPGYSFPVSFTSMGTMPVELWSPMVVPALFADVNGDGLTDVIPAHFSDHVYLSTGTGFVTKPINLQYRGHAMSFAWHDRVADVNQDGYDDLLLFTGGGTFGISTPLGWYVFLSTGDGYSTTPIFLGGPTLPTISLLEGPNSILADVTGDGLKDLLVTTEVNLHRWTQAPFDSAIADLATSIADGLGHVTSLEYTPLSLVAGYGTPGSATPPSTRMVRDPIPVVTLQAESDGIGGTTEKSFVYSNGRRDMRGRGFLGFEKISISDNRANNTDIELEYLQEFPWTGRIAKRTERNPDNSLLVNVLEEEWAEHTWNVPDPADRRAVYREKQTVHSYVSDTNAPQIGGTVGAHVSSATTEALTFNLTHGVVSKTKRTVGNGWINYSVTEELTLDDGLASTSVWCLGFPTNRTITAAPVAGTRQSSSEWHAQKCSLLSERGDLQQVAGEQRRTAYEYDQWGRLEVITVDDAAGTLAAAGEARRTEFFYTRQVVGRPAVKLQYIAGETPHAIVQEWDAGFGAVKLTTDPRGLSLSYGYDDFGRMTDEAVTGGESVTTAYLDCGTQCVSTHAVYRVREESSTGHWQETEHDQLGRIVAEKFILSDGSISYRAVAYNSLGQQVETTAPAIGGVSTSKTVYAYDVEGRQRTVTSPTESGTTTELRIRSGLEEQVTDGDGNSTVYGFRPDGVLTMVSDALGKTTTYLYGAFGDLKKIVDAGGNVTDFTYDVRGRLISVDDPDSSGLWEHSYNVFDEVVASRSPGTAAPDWTVETAYDQLGRVTTRVEDEGTTVWSYYSDNTATEKRKGLLSAVTMSGNYGYDEQIDYGAIGTPLEARVRIDGGAWHKTNYTYDSYGRLSTMTYPEAGTAGRTTYNYGYSYGYEKSVHYMVWGFPVYVYDLRESDALGREQKVRYGNSPNAIHQRFGYHSASGRLVSIQAGTGETGTDVQDYTYAWDKVGNLTGRAVPGGISESFSYDALNRLEETALLGYTMLTMTYDDAAGNTGNIKSKSDVGTYTYGQWGMGSRQVTTVSNGPRAMTYLYDVRGNMVCRGWDEAQQQCADELDWYSYDLPERVEAGTASATFLYGPDRQRIRQVAATPGGTTTTDYVGTHFQIETSGSSTRYVSNIFANSRVVYTVAEGMDGAQPIYDAYSVHPDHQGSWDQLTPAAGMGSTLSYSFDAWGKRRNPDWTPDVNDVLLGQDHWTKRGYTGHEYLDSINLVHMNGRLQDPILGRMISRDPWLGDVNHPDTLNRYSYVLNNPLRFTDPSGFGACEVKGAVDGPQVVICEDDWGGPRGDERIDWPGPDNDSGYWTRVDFGDSAGFNWKFYDESCYRPAKSCFAPGVIPFDINRLNRNMFAIGASSGPDGGDSLGALGYVLGAAAAIGNAAFENSPVMWLFNASGEGVGDAFPVEGAEANAAKKMAEVPLAVAGAIRGGGVGKGLTTAGKFFGSKTASEASMALARKFGAPRSTRPGAMTFYNPNTGRSFNVHTDPAHGLPHVDIRTRGSIPDRKVLLRGGP